MRFRTWIPLLILCAALCGCGDDNETVTDPISDSEPTYATLGFTFDDSIVQGYTAASGLAWKGTFSYDAATGVMAYDAYSTGPFVMLHDDGPVSAGGHEPEGATADDHIWGATARLETPAEDVTLRYGVIAGSIDGGDGPWLRTNEMQTIVIASGEESSVVVPGQTVYFTPPANTALVEFAIDDSASQTYASQDGLAWKGSFSFDAATRTLSYDGSWQGPFVMVWDDGAWNEGGHEASGATAGDHAWSVAVWVPNQQAVQLEYGAVSGSVNGSDGDWIWTGGSNGVLQIPAGAVGPLTAPGMVLP